MNPTRNPSEDVKFIVAWPSLLQLHCTHLACTVLQFMFGWLTQAAVSCEFSVYGVRYNTTCTFPSCQNLYN